MKMDRELSREISDKIPFERGMHYFERVRQALLTQERLSSGLYVEGWVVLDCRDRVEAIPSKNAWIELGETIIDILPNSGDCEIVHFPGLRFTREQVSKFRKVPRYNRYGPAGQLSSKFSKAYVEAIDLCLARGYQKALKDAGVKRHGTIGRLIEIGCFFPTLMVVGSIIIFSVALFNTLRDLVKDLLKKVRR